MQISKEAASFIAIFLAIILSNQGESIGSSIEWQRALPSEIMERWLVCQGLWQSTWRDRPREYPTALSWTMQYLNLHSSTPQRHPNGETNLRKEKKRPRALGLQMKTHLAMNSWRRQIPRSWNFCWGFHIKIGEFCLNFLGDKVEDRFLGQIRPT